MGCAGCKWVNLKKIKKTFIAENKVLPQWSFDSSKVERAIFV